MVSLRTICCLLLGAWCLNALCADAMAADTRKATDKKLGKNTYMSNCEACHMMGKNVLKPGKDIVESTKLVSLEEFKTFLSQGRGMMPSFKKIADDPAVVEALYRYAKTLKTQNWNYEPPADHSPSEPVPPVKKKQGDKEGRPT